MNTEGVQKKR